MLFLISASLIWAFSFGLIKAEASQIDPFILGAARTAMAAIFFLPWFLRSSPQATPRSLYIKAAICGFVQLGLMYGPYLLSFRYLKGHEVALYTMTTPILMALMIQLANRQVTWRLVFASLLATIGGMVAAGGNLNSSPVGLGIALVQLSNILFAVGVLLWTAWFSPIEHQQSKLMFPFFLGAFFASALLSVLFAKSWRPLSTNEWFVAIYLGVLASGVGFFLWNKGAMRVGPAVLSSANNMKLPIAVIVSLTVFHETADISKLLLGSSMIIAAIMLTARRDAQPKAR